MGCIGFLVYRFNAVFNPSKTRAAVASILCFFAGCLVFALGADFASVGGGLLLFSLIYGCVWLYKYNRDKKIAAPPVATELPAQTITKSNPDSNRLYVPEHKRDM
jgi:hypothetical protein